MYRLRQHDSESSLQELLVYSRVSALPPISKFGTEKVRGGSDAAMQTLHFYLTDEPTQVELAEFIAVGLLRIDAAPAEITLEQKVAWLLREAMQQAGRILRGGVQYEIRIENDTDVEDPCELEHSWTVYSFYRRHAHRAPYHTPADMLNEDNELLPELQEQLDAGLAFFLDYFEHGLCKWTVTGKGPNDRWDASRCAGLAIWNAKPEDLGAKTREEREADCDAFLEMYTAWCNGDCHYVTITDLDTGKVVSDCGGFIGYESLPDAIKDLLPADATADNVRLAGASKDLVEISDLFKPPVETEVTDAASTVDAAEGNPETA